MTEHPEPLTLKRRTGAVPVTEARYRVSSLPSYAGNPLIEALEDYLLYGNREMTALMERKIPACHPLAVRRQRDSLLGTLTTDLFIPLPRHLGLQEAVDLLIRAGYRKRNPCDSRAYTQFLLGGGCDLTQDDEERLKEAEREDRRPDHGEAMTLAVIGNSGIGKTYGISRVLSLYPQVILHDRIPGYASFVQLTWLKVECPHDGSVKSLCAAIIAEIDRLTGENFTDVSVMSGRATVAVLKTRVSRLLAAYNTGLLVIDEIQNLMTSRLEREQLFNFIVSLSNTLSVPLLFIGTPKAKKLMGTDLRIARRFGSFGVFEWDRLKHEPGDRKEWDQFMGGLWPNTVLKGEDRQISPEIDDAFYDLTQGITDLIVKLFVLSQKVAMLNNQNRLTVKILKWTFNHYFSNVKPMTDAIRNRDMQALMRYQDIGIPDTGFSAAGAELSAEIRKKEEAEDHVSGSAIEATARIFGIIEAMNIELTSPVKAIVEDIIKENREADVPPAAVITEFLRKWNAAEADRKEEGDSKVPAHRKKAPSELNDVKISEAGELETL